LQKADFLAQNAPKSFVAGLRPDPLGSLQRFPGPLAAFDEPTSKRGEKRGKQEREGKMLRTLYGKFLATPLVEVSLLYFSQALFTPRPESGPGTRPGVTGHPPLLWSTQLLACVEILKLSTDNFETRI